MRNVTLGSTGITTIQNAFGALPIQRVSDEEAVRILRAAYDGGMRYFDTARAYSDSEHKIGLALRDVREDIYIATKTMAKDPDTFWADLEQSLAELQTDYIDIYQFHCVPACWRPGDGTGMYECMLEAKEQGKIRHIGVTAHLLNVAFELVESGLYETLQFPFSYLSGEQELELVRACEEANMGFVVMKGMAGGLIRRADVAMAFTAGYNVMPIWGIQKMEELDEWLSFNDTTPEMTPEIEEFIAAERAELAGDFCRGCGYCMPCSVEISINQCARMSLMLRRAPSSAWTTEHWQAEMAKIEDCIDCGICEERCPYQLKVPELLRKNWVDYQAVIAGEVEV